MRKTPTAGSDIDAHCTKCKMVLAHVIIAMKETKVARVECKTCRSTHAYRASAAGNGASKRATAAKTKAPRKSGGLGAKNYEQLMAGRDISRATPYRLTESFGRDDVITHKKFGIGLCTAVLEDGKIEVAFQEGVKVLVHARD